LLPVIPYLLLTGRAAFFTSAAACGLGLFVVGALISMFTGRNMIFSALRMVGIGAIAATITFIVGRLLGVTVAG